MVEDWSLLIQGRMQERKWKEGELEFKITRIEHLSEVNEKMAKNITININQQLGRRFINR